MINKAFLFAAGLGTRLRPYTYETPKPLLNLYGKPIIEYTITNLSKLGVNDITINTFHLKEQFESILQLSEKYKVNIKLSPQDKLYLHGGDLSFAKDFLESLKENENFFAINSDTLFQVDKNELMYLDNKVNSNNPFGIVGFQSSANPLRIYKDKVVGCGNYFYKEDFENLEFQRGDNFGIQIINSSIKEFLLKEPQEFGFYDNKGLINKVINQDKNVIYHELSNFLRFELSTVEDFKNYKNSTVLKEIIYGN